MSIQPNIPPDTEQVINQKRRGPPSPVFFYVPLPDMPTTSTRIKEHHATMDRHTFATTPS